MQLNNISIDYDFSNPEYIFDNIGFQTPRFQATCSIKKTSDLYIYNVAEFCTGPKPNKNYV